MTAIIQDNQRRLQVLVDAFDLSLEEVSKVVGVSRSLLSRVLHGHEGINHMVVYGKLEKKLPEIIALRGKAYFHVEAVEVEKVEGLKD